MDDQIRHQGRIVAITKDGIQVKISRPSACHACQAYGHCMIADAKTDIIHIPQREGRYVVGQEVTVVLKKSLGLKAVCLAYFFPFLVLFSSLIILTQTFNKEWIAGLLSLCILIVYYLLLYLNRDQIQSRFKMDIEVNSLNA